MGWVTRNVVLDSASFSIPNAKIAILIFDRLLRWSCWYCPDAALLPAVRE